LNAHRIKYGYQILLLTALTGILMVTSCRNDMETIRSLDIHDTVPDMSAKEGEILFSEKGKVQVKLTAPTLVRTTMDNEPVIEFPDGFTVFFYDSTFQVKSTITGDYGISFEKRKIMEARHNVIVENLETEEKMNTEQLFWDQNKETIYTEKFVRITRGEEVITADGLVSDQSFESMEFDNPKGLIEGTDDW
jgi:LPS export ABC transporter protein LptC